MPGDDETDPVDPTSPSRTREGVGGRDSDDSEPGSTGEQAATVPHPSPPPQAGEGAGDSPRIGAGLRGMSLGLLLLIGACIGGGAVRWVAELFRDEPAPTEVIEVRPTADVIVAVRDLARLESASYHVERVIDLSSRQRHLFGLVEAEDQILLVAAADVIAGVDLTEMEDGDVVIEPDRDRAVVTLPPVRIFSARLDNDRTYVHSRDTDLLARRRDGLETQARQEAERTLRDAAIEGGILRRAERNAAQTIETLVRSLGYTDVEVRFRSAEGR